MINTIRAMICITAGLCCATAATPQTTTPTDTAFTSDNAILDTSILFAIGAHEARQELRGSFGWPTFQEGLVDGVYFRFDPDGYARFAPTPRLDSDVFEVICRPRTFTCMGRKGMMSIILTPQGQPQLELEGTTPNDLFYVADGISELQIPGRILQPLDPHLEALLSAGGELIARRGVENDINRVSLTGFSAVTTYLRWINARQDYAVLPRNWPVPNSTAERIGTNLTQTSDWRTTRPQPQSQPILAAQVSAQPSPTAEVAEVRQELDSLRQLLVERGAQNVANQNPARSAQPDINPSNVDQLELAAAQILRDLEILRSQQLILSGDQISTLNAAANPNEAIPSPIEPNKPVTQNQTDAGKLSNQLEYLMTEIGLDAQTALLLVQLRDSPKSGSTPTPTLIEPIQAHQSETVEAILKELQNQLEPATILANADIVQSTVTNDIPPNEYQLLTDYFQSVFTEQIASSDTTE